MTDANGSRPTFRDLYELMDERTHDIDNKIQHLSNRFDSLEAGRVSRLETQLADLKGRLAVWGVLGGSGLAIATAIITSAISN